MSEREILVPDLGGFKDVLIIDVLVKPGDRVGPDTPILTLETEKATMDVPAGAAGVIGRLLVKNGGQVSEGTAIATLEVDPESGAAPAAETKTKPSAAQSAPAKSAPTPPATEAVPAAKRASAPAAGSAINESGFALAHASPGVRRFARELGVDLSRVNGAGTQGAYRRGRRQVFHQGRSDRRGPGGRRSGRRPAPRAGAGL